ncbi:hypothetical protein J6TS1_50020 [Siminovitchia terrae]|uniref:Uncharacterized protein n=1 Tax=Siminovitchia terrae TaxID=1914933 RepID=A0ABQ4L544_SIMTE|nr:hypothetical protein [Siminovitchia terrae]GIN91896.1 hypothetical protein J22TS1_29470 [Siminovitchia terrae]GIN99132.1 hypothetical protein J6TS1_50020 [Siminovitchia terrae]
MKNHVQVNGQIININKKVSDLSMKQRNWIAETLRTEMLIFLEQNLNGGGNAIGVY